MLKFLKSLGYKLNRLIFNYLVKNKFIMHFFGRGYLDDDYGIGYGYEPEGYDYYEGYDVPDEYFYDMGTFEGGYLEDEDILFGDPFEDFPYDDFYMDFNEIQEEYEIFDDYDPNEGF